MHVEVLNTNCEEVMGGFTAQIDKEHYEIEIFGNKKLLRENLKEYTHLLFHELVHCRQFYRGKLFYNRAGILHFDGEPIDFRITEAEQPCEIEAEATARVLNFLFWHVDAKSLIHKAN